MIETEHNPLLLGGGWVIETERPSHKKDRAQAVAYEVRGATPRRRNRRLSRSEEYALAHDLWIAERCSDDLDAWTQPAHQRPGLLRAVQLFLCGGGLLLERLGHLGDELTQAAVVDRFLRAQRQIVADGVLIDPRYRDTLVSRAGGQAVVDQACETLFPTAMQGFLAYMQEHEGSPFLIGSGEARGYEAACVHAATLRLEGAGQKEIIERLNLEGYINQNGVRRWHTRNVPRSGS